MKQPSEGRQTYSKALTLLYCNLHYTTRLLFYFYHILLVLILVYL